MSQAILFALDALRDELDDLHQKSNSAIFEHRPVRHGDLRHKEAIVKACITLLSGITITPHPLPVSNGKGVHR